MAGLGIYIDMSYLDEEEGMTPSPSPSFTFPSVPSQTRAPVLAPVPRIGGGNASVGLGIDIPQFQTAELRSSYRED